MRTEAITKLCVIVGVGLLLNSAIGCSDGRPTRVHVSGQVLIDGEPLRNGSIRFVNPHTRAAGGRLDSEGRFVASCFEKGDGVIPGTHRICVSSQEGLGVNKVRWHAPKKYADESTSGIELTIEEPTNNLLIELTWEGKKPFVERR